MFGCVNGLALVLNNGWRMLKMPKLPFLISWSLTMLSVLISFVYFRSESIEAAHNFITAMFSIEHFFFRTGWNYMQRKLVFHGKACLCCRVVHTQ